MTRKGRFRQLDRYIGTYHAAMVECWREIGSEIVALIRAVFGKRAVKEWCVGDYGNQYGVTIKLGLCTPHTYWSNRGKQGWEHLGAILLDELRACLDMLELVEIRICDEDLIPSKQVKEVREKIRAWLSANYVVETH